ncbi:hypothetical protein RDWZM_006059 [Blomia tropicalis]|uniref:C2H2-type domain-containing protein n=1 Tax=Blomia tropicalis TaxID=40697 RepID=A0A9Q0M9P0_BLOTA|nr:hypothetical protein RDWZM_006059 [Blomia tropicalis]
MALSVFKKRYNTNDSISRAECILHNLMAYRVDPIVDLARREAVGPSNFRIKELSLQCTIPGCPYQCADKLFLRVHLLEIHGQLTHRCFHRGCYQSFKQCKELSFHYINDHAESINRRHWPCAQCEKHFDSPKLLSDHVTQFHELGHFRCSCGEYEIHGNRRSVHSHIQYHHRSPLYRCPEKKCSNSYVRRLDLVNHLRFHYDIKTKRCSLCGKGFVQTCDYKRHMNSHMGHKPYRCIWPECTKSAGDRAIIFRHIRVQHFNLPATKKEQRELGITDNRDASKYIKNTDN